jgi:ABC-type phosphate/phosphonate transport system substrate-binding protein
MLRIGAVAYAPYVVTIFEGLKRHFHREGVELDWVLYSNYDALVTAFVTGEVDLAWNGPLAYVKIRRALAEPCRVVAMRDIDVGYTTQFITQRGSSMQQIADVRGRRFAFGRQASVQAGLLAYHYLKEAGLVPGQDLVYTFHEERTPTDRADEAAVLDLVASGEYDAGAISGNAIATLRAQGRFPEDLVRVFWQSQGYSHCCFTAQSRINDALAQKITATFLSMRYDNPEHREVLALEHCKAFVPGTTEGFDTLEKAAEAEGLIA